MTNGMQHHLIDGHENQVPREVIAFHALYGDAESMKLCHDIAHGHGGADHTHTLPRPKARVA